MTNTRRIALSLALAALLPLVGCTSAYYGMMEQIGVEKRHILRDRVEAGQEAQEEAQQQFETTYEAFKTVTRYDGGDLEDFYDKMEAELEDCEARAQDVRDRIASIEQVSGDLFSEWASEIDQISNANLRRQSEESLRNSERRYDRMIGAMQKASAKMDPVIIAFRDQVLFLKHNLNARAVASLETNVTEIQGEVDALIRDMDSAINEAQRFLESMPS